MHYGVALAGGVVRLGIGGKILDRAELDRTYTASQVSAGELSFGQQWEEGLGFGADVGALVTMPVEGLPTFGLAVQDAGTTSFKNQRILFTSDSAPAGSPPSLQQKVNTGLSMTFKQGRGTRTLLALDYKDVTRINGDYLDHLHLGFDINYSNAFHFRAGLNEGRYWTLGLAMEADGMSLELGTYGENLASQGATRVDDRKYLFRYVVAF